MALKIRRFATATAAAAIVSLLATPAYALDLPLPARAQVFDADALNAARHDDWDDDDIDTGDVIAGVAVLGAIVAIATSASRNNNRYEQRYPLPDNDYGYRTPGGYERNDSRGIDRAVDMCVSEVELGSNRVGTVDNATRTAEGWRVSGALENGAGYSCTIGNDGRVYEINTGSFGYGTAPAEAVEDNQWDDEAYARARQAQSAPPPLPDYDTDYDGDFDSDDDLYDTARAPDFE